MSNGQEKYILVSRELTVNENIENINNISIKVIAKLNNVTETLGGEIFKDEERSIFIGDITFYIQGYLEYIRENGSINILKINLIEERYINLPSISIDSIQSNIVNLFSYKIDSKTIYISTLFHIEIT